jgi:hypothetical protein
VFYEVDEAAQARRYFSSKVRYSEIDWSNLDQIVDAYRQRIEDWYFDPARELAKNIHFAFSVMALNCLLIDTMSQFVAGIDSSSKKKFIEFIRNRLPGMYSCVMRSTIRHYDVRPAILKDVAEVLYYGFRCGILHQAHIPPYGGVDPGADPPVRVDVSGLVKYTGSGADCPSVIINPLKLLGQLGAAFEVYLQELKDRDPKNDQLRENFKKKFSASFGIDIRGAT